MISFANISMMFGQKVLWSSVDLTLPFKKKYAIVGGNGSGKSTLLKIISSQEECIDGEIKFSGIPSIGFLQQDQFVDGNMQVIDLVIKGNESLWKIKKIRNELYEKNSLTDDDGCKLGELEDEYLHLGGYEAESKAAKLLIGLGIDESKHYKASHILSGGYKIRALLAQALFNNPDILLLDEPTNHLDISSISWLEKYLRTSYQGTLILISHDRSFVNSVVNYVLDIDYGDIRLYKGNYDDFEKEKEIYADQIKKRIELADSKVGELKKFIDRFGAKATKAKQAKSKQKMIDKMEMPDFEKSSRQYPNFNFNLMLKEPQGKQLLKVNNLSHGFDDNFLFTDFNFKIHQGEKIWIIGPNGVGKSTFIKLLLNEYQPIEGEIKWSERAKISYISQVHHEQLDGNMTLLSWLNNELTNIDENKCRRVLANVLFKKEDVMKKISTLSGGECTRLLLARSMGSEQNFLIMDEPTNHLDIEAIFSLVEALKAYKGTLLLVSHDRAFASYITNRILIMSKNKITAFSGNYNDYMEKHNDLFFED